MSGKNLKEMGEKEVDDMVHRMAQHILIKFMNTRPTEELLTCDWFTGEVERRRQEVLNERFSSKDS